MQQRLSRPAWIGQERSVNGETLIGKLSDMRPPAASLRRMANSCAGARPSWSVGDFSRLEKWLRACNGFFCDHLRA
jgi:hypothetical protein